MNLSQTIITILFLFGFTLTINAQNDCATATSITIGDTRFCADVSNSTFMADMSTAVGTGVEAYSCDVSDRVFWYSFTAPSSGEILLIMKRDVAATIYPDIVIYSGTCGGLTEEFCQQGFNVVYGEIITGLVPGNPYFIQLGNNTIADPTLGEINLCIQENPCSDALAPNDDCSLATNIDPTEAFQGTTMCNYTPSFPSGINFINFPGGDGGAAGGCTMNIDNNSWFVFNASDTELTFNYNVSNCSDNSGIEVVLLEGECDNSPAMTAVAGACASINDADSSTSTTVLNGSGSFSVIGLQIGNPYYLMIDGYVGDRCFYEFTLPACTATPEFLRN